MIQNIFILFFDIIMEMKAHYLKSLKKSAVVDCYFMLYFTDFIILPDNLSGGQIQPWQMSHWVP